MLKKILVKEDAMMKKLLVISALIWALGITVNAQLGDLKGKVDSVKKEAGALKNKASAAAKQVFLKVATDIPFEYNTYKLNLDDPKYSIQGYNIDDFMKKVFIPALANLINTLPGESKVIIIGHASADGTEEPNPPFIGNMALSKKRAEAVLQFILKNSKLKKGKFIIEAKGSSSPLKGVSPTNDKNCRVSFDVR